MVKSEHGASDERLVAHGLDALELLEFANLLADRARPLARSFFRRPMAVDRKEDDSPVTAADRSIEIELRALIQERFPGHALLGEEFGAEGDDRACLWVIDPIDGTRGFITGMPLFGTLIGLLVDSQPVLGVLETPALGERWIRVSGLPTRFNGAPCRTSGRHGLSDASLFATTPAMFSAEEFVRFDSVQRRVSVTRYGADCYAYGLVASGFADLVVEADMKPHDYLGLVAIVEGAGGVMTDWSGRRLAVTSDGTVVAAASPALHREVLELLGD